MEPPPPQPLIPIMLMVTNNTDVANAALTPQTSHAVRPRAARLLWNSSENSINSMIGIQRIGKPSMGMRGGVKGGNGIDPFAVVLTLIPTTAGAPDVIVTGVAGPVHVALRGAPAQLTVMPS